MHQGGTRDGRGAKAQGCTRTIEIPGVEIMQQGSCEFVDSGGNLAGEGLRRVVRRIVHASRFRKGGRKQAIKLYEKQKPQATQTEGFGP
jgi:hypothetical protein